jgi:feruloyl esterase
MSFPRIHAASVAFLICSTPLAAATCEGLASLTLPNTTITSAQTVGAGELPAPAGRGGRGGANFKDLPAFCRVQATVKPTSDSDIKVEVWLPASGWNGKFEAVPTGGGGAGAAIQGGMNINALAATLRGGYATATTDGGHEGPTLSFAIDHPEKLTDWGYRSAHEMTVKARAIISAFYGSPATHSYWNACAAGGRQGLMEAQRYPNDYDGIVVGAAANNWVHLQSWSLSVYEATHKDEASYIPPAKYPLIHKAAVEMCDANDGVKDGVIENPARCKFDPRVLQCKPGQDTSTCLTSGQVEAARKIYAPLMNTRTKAELFAGLEPGSELGWANLADGDQPPLYASETFKYMILRNPSWDYKANPVNFDRDVAVGDMLDNGTATAYNPDLKEFFARGGKLIHYHGWSDPLIAPGDAVNYYKKVSEKVGAAKTQQSMRLYMVPGMNHCRGGEGTDNFELETAIENWVEKGQAPEQIVASRVVDGKVERTRPLCPYPQVAVYKGSGSTDDAANFACRVQ